MPRRKYIQPEERPAPPLQRCPLCGRELAGIVNKHHLLPISQGGAGTQTVPMHKICHDKIHSVLTEQQLRQHYSTPEALRGHPDLEAFIQWVQKRPPEFYDRNRKKR